MNAKGKLAAAFTAVLALGMSIGYLLAPELPQAEAIGGTILCDSYPQFCEPCGVAGGPPCPQGDGGWLCCSRESGICALANGQCGEGYLFGWCENYTTNKDGTVTCHDEA